MKLHRILLSGMLVPCLALFVYGTLPVKGYAKKGKPYVQPYYQPYVNYGYTGNYNYDYNSYYPTYNSGKNSYGKSSTYSKNYWY